MTRTTSLVLSAVLLSACDTSLESRMPADGPPPVSGGTLFVTHDGRIAIASDPDRAAIHVVDLSGRSELARSDLGPEDEPGRATQDAAGHVHVVLRRAGAVLSLDPTSGTELSRRDVCAAPRGIDYDAPHDELVVACAEGLLVRMPAASGGPTSTVKMPPDLRDVIVHADGTLIVSRFTSAEVLVVDGDTIVRTLRPPTEELNGQTWEPTVAWRMRPYRGGVLLMHQQSVSTQLGVLGTFSGTYYGGDCDFGIVHSVITAMNVTDGTTRSVALDTASLGVDVASSSTELYAAFASEPDHPRTDPSYQVRNGVRVVPVGSLAPQTYCTLPEDPQQRQSAAVAVDVTPAGQLVAQYRDPGKLTITTGSGNVDIPLSGGRAQHIGHAVFHEAAGTGVTCASCHPEGGDDGHVWAFDVGSRRTPSLRGGLLSTAPFHWAGDVPNVNAVMDGTFVGRMGGAEPRQDEIDSLGRWMDALPAVVAPAQASVDHGQQVFESADCASCHTGEQGTDNETVDVGTGGSFQVPRLRELAIRAPYFHDGSAASLEDVVLTHGAARSLAESDRADLVAYLESR